VSKVAIADYSGVEFVSAIESANRQILPLVCLPVWVSVDQLPSLSFLFWIGEFDIVCYNVNLAGFFLSNQVGENASNDGHHSTGDDDNGNVMFFGVRVELLEPRIQGDVYVVKEGRGGGRMRRRKASDGQLTLAAPRMEH
jgi:hypothetical protein